MFGQFLPIAEGVRRSLERLAHSENRLPQRPWPTVGNREPGERLRIPLPMVTNRREVFVQRKRRAAPGFADRPCESAAFTGSRDRTRDARRPCFCAVLLSPSEEGGTE